MSFYLPHSLNLEDPGVLASMVSGTLLPSPQPPNHLIKQLPPGNNANANQVISAQSTLLPARHKQVRRRDLTQYFYSRQLNEEEPSSSTLNDQLRAEQTNQPFNSTIPHPSTPYTASNTQSQSTMKEISTNNYQNYLPPHFNPYNLAVNANKYSLIVEPNVISQVNFLGDSMAFPSDFIQTHVSAQSERTKLNPTRSAFSHSTTNHSIPLPNLDLNQQQNRVEIPSLSSNPLYDLRVKSHPNYSFLNPQFGASLSHDLLYISNLYQVSSDHHNATPSRDDVPPSLDSIVEKVLASEAKGGNVEMLMETRQVVSPIIQSELKSAEKDYHSADFGSYITAKYHKVVEQLRKNKLLHSIIFVLTQLGNSGQLDKLYKYRVLPPNFRPDPVFPSTHGVNPNSHPSQLQRPNPTPLNDIPDRKEAMSLPQIFANCLFFITGRTVIPVSILNLLISTCGGRLVMSVGLLGRYKAENRNLITYIIGDQLSASRFEEMVEMERKLQKQFTQWQRERNKGNLAYGTDQFGAILNFVQFSGAHHPHINSGSTSLNTSSSPQHGDFATQHDGPAVRGQTGNTKAQTFIDIFADLARSDIQLRGAAKRKKPPSKTATNNILKTLQKTAGNSKNKAVSFQTDENDIICFVDDSDSSSNHNDSTNQIDLSHPAPQSTTHAQVQTQIPLILPNGQSQTPQTGSAPHSPELQTPHPTQLQHQPTHSSLGKKQRLDHSPCQLHAFNQANSLVELDHGLVGIVETELKLSSPSSAQVALRGDRPVENDHLVIAEMDKSEKKPPKRALWWLNERWIIDSVLFGVKLDEELYSYFYSRNPQGNKVK